MVLKIENVGKSFMDKVERIYLGVVGILTRKWKKRPKILQKTEFIH